MAGRHSRTKGLNFERAIVKLFQEHGLAAERVPGSGQAGGSFGGDINVPILGIDHRLEAKIQASGFKTIYGWIEGVYGLVLRADRSEPLICIRLKDFAHLVRTADGERVKAASAKPTGSKAYL